jgi:hypothetical protein
MFYRFFCKRKNAWGFTEASISLHQDQFQPVRVARWRLFQWQFFFRIPRPRVQRRKYG